MNSLNQTVQSTGILAVMISCCKSSAMPYREVQRLWKFCWTCFYTAKIQKKKRLQALHKADQLQHLKANQLLHLKANLLLHHKADLLWRKRLEFELGYWYVAEGSYRVIFARATNSSKELIFLKIFSIAFHGINIMQNDFIFQLTPQMCVLAILSWFTT